MNEREKGVKLYRVREVAELLGVSKKTVYMLIQSGQLPAIRIGARGGGLRVSHADLVEFIERRRLGGKGT